MSFIPRISITTVPKDSKSITFEDITGDYNGTSNTTGYGSPTGPTEQDDIVNVWAEINPYGEEPVQVTTLTGDLTAQKVVVAIPDGVNTLYAYYGMIREIEAIISEDRLSITSEDSNFESYMDGIAAIGTDTNFPTKVSYYLDGTLVLETALEGALSQYSQVYVYYKGSQQILLLNAANAKIVNQIAKLPLKLNKCDTEWNIFNMIGLVKAAKQAYECCNPAKAHEAARLITGNKPYVNNSENCTSCGQ